MQHLDEGTIHAWLDEQLPRDEAAGVEAHVAECRECADAVAEARGLIAASSRILTALDNVPREVAPKAAAIGHQPSGISSDGGSGPPTQSKTPASQRARRRWLNVPSLAAAATIVVAVGTLSVMRAVRMDEASLPPQSTAQLERGAGPSADSQTAAADLAAPLPTVATAPSVANAPAVANEVRSRVTAGERRALADGAAGRAAGQPEPRPMAPAEPPSSAAARARVAFADTAPAPVAMRESIASQRADLSRAAPLQQQTTEPKDQKRAAANQRDEQLSKAREEVAARPAVPQPRPDTTTVTVFRGAKVAAQQSQNDPARQEAAAKTMGVVAATGVIRGRVADANNTGLESVAVTVVGTSIGVTTSGSGQFELRGVPAGTQRVIARRVGFEPTTREITVAAGQATTVDFKLTAASVALENVVVTGAAASAPRRAAVGSTIAPASPPQLQSATAVGCYDISITPVSPQARNGFRQVPRRLALDSTVVPTRTDGVWYQVRDLARTEGTAGNGVWRPTTGDGIEAQWTYGSRTATLRLTGVPGPVLRGSLEEIDRATAVGEAGVAVAAKVRCGS